MRENGWARTGWVACGGYECKAVLPDDPGEKTQHMLREHPEVMGMIYLPCDPPPDAA